MVKILSKLFGYTKDGRKVTAYEMRNDNGMCVTILDYGGTIQSIIVPDKNGKPTDVALGYKDVKSYETGNSYYGATVGRYANRIRSARFVLNGKEYSLIKNDGNNHLHGVFCKSFFDAQIADDELILRYFSRDMEEGFPGNLTLQINYRLSDDNALELTYTATTDATTVVNITNHCYFNLNGQDGSTILDHELYLNSSRFTEIDQNLIMTGNIIPVENTPFDFRKAHTIGERYNEDYQGLKYGMGYDHNMILDGKDGEMKTIGKLKSRKSGIEMEAFTTEPAVQFYSGNIIDYDPVSIGKTGVRYPKNGGLCLEAQHYPDSINHAAFPSTVLQKGETYRQKTIYRFKTVSE